MRAKQGWLKKLASTLRTALLLLVMPSLLVGCDKVRSLVGTSPEQARAIAKAAYIEGYPLLVSYGAMYRKHINQQSGQYLGPLNQILAEVRLHAPGDVNVFNPNNDVLLGTLQLDLRAEPIVLCMPTMGSERYYSVQLVDMNMFNFGSIDQRKSTNTAGCSLVSGPRFAGVLPTGVRQVLRSSTDFATAIYRTQVTDPTDLDLAAQTQSGYTMQPLSAYVANGSLAPGVVTPVPWRSYTDAALSSDFLPMFSYVLQFALSDDKNYLADLGKIGIGPQAKTPYEALSPEIKAAVQAGLADGAAAIAKKALAIDHRTNGWQDSAPYGSRSSYNGDDLLRAAAAQRAPFAPDPRDAMFMQVKTDSRGTTLDGSIRSYRVTFPAGSLPPVRAFWSLTMYDARTHRLVDNPLGRYVVNKAMTDRMITGPDGSLTVYIQVAAPAQDLQSNWLPAPDGPFELILRMYMPSTDRPSILPPGHGTWQPPAIQPAA